MANELTDNDLQDVLASDSLVVVDFWAEWCGPCRKISPIVDELASEYEGVVDIRKCDVEENPDCCEHFGIMNIPTVVFLKKGEVVDRHVGTTQKDHLKELIEKNK